MAVEYNTPHFFVTFTGVRHTCSAQWRILPHAPCLTAFHVRRTANEHGLSDLTAACNGLHHTKCPVEATRIYNRRWEAFLKSYLKGASPIGDITRVWWRQEDQVKETMHLAEHMEIERRLRSPPFHAQARGSLHVHKTLHDMGPTLRNNCDKEHIWRRARYATSYQI